MKVEFYNNFEKSLDKLLEFAAEKIENDRDRAGLIQGFEFTYEQCWKALQKKASAEGNTVVSPKQCFAWAHSFGWITDESLWIEMIKDRNLTTHTYRDAVALAVAQNITEKYCEAFQSLLTEMKK